MVLHNHIMRVVLFGGLVLSMLPIFFHWQYEQEVEKNKVLAHQAGTAVNYRLKFRKVVQPDDRAIKSEFVFVDPIATMAPVPVYSYFAMKHYWMPSTIHYD